MEEQTKVCLKCHVRKPESSFVVFNSKKYKYNFICNDCKSLCIECGVNKKRNEKPRCNECIKKLAEEKDAFETHMMKVKYSVKHCNICNAPLGSSHLTYCNLCKEKLKHLPKKIDCCSILIEHHEKFKDDPERLTTRFIKNLLDCSCEVKIND